MRWARLILGFKPMSPSKLFDKYRVQLCYCLVLITFLAASVGEGQASNMEPYNLSDEVIATSGFIGKPQLMGGQTILTGEIQQSVVIVYRVAKGDTILDIAKRYNLSVGSILDANHMKALDAANIQPRQKLIIPAEDTNTSLAWLKEINKEKERQARLAEEARLEALASQYSWNGGGYSQPSYTTYSGYQVIGTDWGSYGGSIPGQCTSYVNKIFNLPNLMGNGNQYLASARAYGMATGSVPRNYSIIQTNESWYGHVGVVVEVSATTITIQDMNYAGEGVITRRTLSVNDPRIVGYVYAPLN